MQGVYKRPLPQNCDSIGFFRIGLQLASYASILSYSGLLVYTSDIVEDIGGEDMRAVTKYMILVAGFFVLKFMLDYSFGDISSKLKNFIGRQSMIVDTKIKNFTQAG